MLLPLRVLTFGGLCIASTSCLLLYSASEFTEPGPAQDAASSPDTSPSPEVDAGAAPDADADAAPAGPVVVAAGLTAPRELTVSGEDLVWVDGRAIQRCHRTGCPEAQTVAVATGDVFAMSESFGTLAWGMSPATMRGLAALPDGGVDAGSGFLVRDLARAPVGLWLEARALFWLERTGAIRRCDPLTVCTANTVDLVPGSDAPQVPMIFGNGTLFWVEPGFDIVACTNAASSACTQPLTLVAGESSEPVAMSAGPETFAWISAAGELRSVASNPVGGPHAANGLATGLVDVKGVVVREPYVYVATGTRVRRFPVGGGEPSTLVEYPRITAFALDDERLYVAESETGTIFSVAMRSLAEGT